MICSRRIYKGEYAEVSIPFMVEGWSDLYVEYFTDGEYKILRNADELEIDEYTITAVFQGNDLDLLDDGVLYYNIYYTLDGDNYIDSTNTPYVVKTPEGYSAKTEDEIYQAGYDAGLEDCSGGTPCDCSSAYTEGYHEGEVVGKAAGYASGYTDGYNQGQEDCPQGSGTSCNLQEKTYILDENFAGASGPITPDSGYDGFSSFEVSDEGYRYAIYADAYEEGYGDGHDSGYTEGYAAGQEDCSGSTPCDCSSAITEAYQSGYTEGYNQGQEECSGGSCDLQTKYIQLTAHTQTFTAPKGNRPTPPSGASVVYGGDYEEFYNLVSGNTDSELVIRMWNNPHLLTILVGRFCFVDGSLALITLYGTTYIDDIYDEWTLVSDTLYGKIWLYNDRSNFYFAMSLVNDWFFGGYEKEDLILPTKSIDGYDVIHISGSSCPESIEEAYQSGYTEGYNQGQADCPECDCSSAITEAYQSGYTEGYDVAKSECDCTEAYESGFTEGYDSGHTDGYTEGYDEGYSIGHDDGYQEGYDSGYEEGSAAHCNLESIGYQLTGNRGFTDNINPSSVGSSAAGFSWFSVDARPYGQNMYNSGYAAGLADCDCSSEVAAAYDSGYTEGFDDGFVSGMTSHCESVAEEAYDEGFNSGVTEGYNSRLVRFRFAFQSVEMNVNDKVPRNLYFNGRQQLVSGYGAAGVPPYTDTLWVESYTTASEVLPSAASCEVHTSISGFPASFDSLIIRTADWKSVTASTEYITSTLVETDEDGYWYRIDFKLNNSAYINSNYDRGYGNGYDEGYAAGLAACQQNQ